MPGFVLAFTVYAFGSGVLASLGLMVVLAAFSADSFFGALVGSVAVTVAVKAWLDLVLGHVFFHVVHTSSDKYSIHDAFVCFFRGAEL